ncbi:transcriptional regulator [Streptomyces sp. WAC 06783]|uniref:helix-turn-helix domain-containing protein n=1 Tax=Streptomyces sp. WAC 06783 TaxID=2203211 RepID=UPI000F746E01|nr:helix-turn-helix transcriptional regulator [Streptomyces sp. WAC 06783]RSO07020.1 transcriptional regulator [Streptomyces sp. WAC 06783]
MSASPSPAAHEARHAVALRLREMRYASGLTASEVAARCGWHKAKSSRLENARTSPSDSDIRAWCAACGALDQAEDLIAASRTAESMYAEWRRLHRSGIRHHQEAAVPLYDRTRLFRVYCSNVIPGLLQTRAYATALLSAINRFQGTPDDADEAADARLARSHVIREGRHRFLLLVEEVVLRYHLTGPGPMTAQLDFLLEAMALPAVSLGVIPLDARRSMWPLETFMIFDEERAQVETLSAEINITAPSEIRVYLKAFDQLQQMAVYGDKARRLVLCARAAFE